jgi:hypothetical protein
MFELYGPRQTEFLNYIRSVAAANDGGRWRFEAAGEEQTFEEIGAYSTRAIPDRFTVEMLDRYLGALGIHAFDERFYKPIGLLVERTGPVLTTTQIHSLAAAREALGL